MKAYVVRRSAHLAPFQKPASEVRLKEGTVGARLRGQLKELGCEIVVVHAVDVDTIENGSLVVHDDVFLSDRFLRTFVKAIPDPRKSYRCEIDGARFPLLSASEVAPSFKGLPVFYYGDAGSRADAQPLRMMPTPVHSVTDGLPNRMHMMTGIRVFFFDFYAVELTFWFDLHTATSLYGRERVSNLVRFAQLFVPAFLLLRILAWRWVMERTSVIGKRCRIHPTAVLEGCTLGDDVEIGPYTYLRCTVVADGAIVREKSTSKGSFIGEGAYLLGSDVVNSYVGAETSIFSPMLFNVVFGERGFLSGGSGFADFIVGASAIKATIDGKDVASNLSFLGSAVGDDCFLGANLIFAPGRTIPSGTRILDHGLIKAVPQTPGGSFVLSGPTLLQIPAGFLGAQRS